MVNISAVKSEIKRLREPAYSSSDALGSCCPKTMGHAASELVRSVPKSICPTLFGSSWSD